MVGQQRVIGGEDAVDAVTVRGQRGDITSFTSVVYVGLWGSCRENAMQKAPPRLPGLISASI